MKKSITGFLSCFSAILILLTLSCSMDLEPAKAGDTSISFTVGALQPPANARVLPDSPSARAVAPGTGYLYIRTLGGPTGSTGPFYGPYQLNSGDSFTTSDIPAGSYDGIGVLYATERLDNLTAEWEGQTLTFAALMQLPDDDFALITDGTEVEGQENPFESILNGRASGELLENVTIVENENNPLSLTLVPICGPSSIIMSEIPENNVYTETGDADQLIRKFIELDTILLPEGYEGNLVATISAEGAPYIGTVAMFDEGGGQVGSTAAINATLSADRELSVPWTGGETYYLYIEYRASALSLAFSSDGEFIPENTHIYYISQEGTGDGQRVNTAMGPVDFANVLSASETTNWNIRAYLVDDITITSNNQWTVSQSNQLSLTSLDLDTPATVTIENGGEMKVDSDSTLILSHVILDGSTESSTYTPLIDVAEGTLILDNKATLQNRTGNTGGVIVHSGGSLVMNDGSLITNCTSTDTTGGGGGGVSLQSTTSSQTTFTMNGGTIQNCTADNYGGGVYATGNVKVTMSGGTIDTCTATGQGGGFYLDGSASLTLSLNASITDTTTENKPNGWAITYTQAVTISPAPTSKDIQAFINPWEETPVSVLN